MLRSPPATRSPRCAPRQSADGRYVVTEQDQQVYVTDTVLDTTTLVSKAPDGSAANGSSQLARISGNGKFVVYDSFASNLTADSAGMLGNQRQVFRYNVTTGKNIRVSRSPNGALPTEEAVAPSVSSTGRYVVFHSWAHNIVRGDHNKRADVFRYDAELGQTIKVSETLTGGEPDRDSFLGFVSPNGRYVGYATNSQNMTTSDTNGSVDAYLYDVQADTTVLASRLPSGVAAGKTTLTSVTNTPIVTMSSTSPRLSPLDTDPDPDDFVYRARTGTVELVTPDHPIAGCTG